MINARLIAYLSAAALAAVVLTYSLGRYQGAAAELAAEKASRKRKEQDKKINQR